jgi:signal transduction histidine kinase
MREFAEDSLQKALTSGLTGTDRANALVSLSILMVEGNNEGALRLSKEAYSIYEEANQRIGMGKACYAISLSATDLGLFEKADSLLKKAEFYLKDTEEFYWLASIQNAFGKLHFVQGNYWLASFYFGTAAKMFAQKKDTIKMVRSYSNMINTMGEAKNSVQAIKEAKRLIPLLHMIKEHRQEAYLWYGLILQYSRLKQFDSASAYVPAALAYADSSSDRYIAGYLYGVVGQHYMLQKQYKKALPWLQKALNTFKKNNTERAVAEYEVMLAESYLQLNDLNTAQTQLTSGLTKAEEFKIAPVLIQGYLTKSNLLKLQGFTDEALGWMQKYIYLKDSIYDQEATQYSAYLEASFVSNLKEEEINQLNLDKAMQEVELLKRNRILWGGGLGALTILVISMLMYRNIRQKQVIAEKQKILQQQQIQFLERQQQVIALQSMVNGQEAERGRIAKDLHDGLGGLLSAIKMHLSTLGQQLPTISQNESFAKSLHLADTASTELRRIAHNMMPEVLLKLGLVLALKDLAQNMSSGKLLKVYVLDYGMNQRLSSTIEIMLFRIVQELLNNIIKHAMATEAHIQLNREDNRLILTVEDNGEGFDASRTFEKSAGMQTIKERVEYLNGKLNIDSRPKEGTTIIIDLLIPSQSKEVS